MQNFPYTLGIPSSRCDIDPFDGATSSPESISDDMDIPTKFSFDLAASMIVEMQNVFPISRTSQACGMYLFFYSI